MDKKPFWTLSRKQMLVAYAFLFIPLIFFLAIRIYPAIDAFMTSFEVKGKQPFYHQYEVMFQDKVFFKALTNTFLYVLITVPLQIIIGLALALLIQSLNNGRGIYRFIYFIPYVTSAVAVSWIWRWMYFKDLGVFNEILKFFGLPAQNFLTHPDQALVSIAVVIIWQAVGFTMLIFLAGLESIPKLYYEAAAIDGASRTRTFFGITLPLLNPTIVFLAVTGVINSLQTFTQVVNMAGPQGGPLNSTKSLVVYIYNKAFLNFNMPYATAMTVVLFVIILVITIIQIKFLSRSYEH